MSYNSNYNGSDETQFTVDKVFFTSTSTAFKAQATVCYENAVSECDRKIREINIQKDRHLVNIEEHKVEGSSKEYTSAEKAFKKSKLITMDYDLIASEDGINTSDNIIWSLLKNGRKVCIEIKSYNDKSTEIYPDNKLPQRYRGKNMTYRGLNECKLSETMHVINNGVGTYNDMKADKAKGFAFGAKFRAQCSVFKRDNESWYFSIEHSYSDSGEHRHKIYKFNSKEGTFKPMYLEIDNKHLNKFPKEDIVEVDGKKVVYTVDYAQLIGLADKIAEIENRY